MIDLRRFFRNPFLDEAISIDETVKYTSNHLAKMIANPAGGTLNPLITGTTTRLNTLGGLLTDETSKLGVQLAKTLAKDTFRKNLTASIQRIHGDFVASFGADSEQVLEAFPGGRDVFNSCADTELETHIGALAGKVTTYTASLKPATVTLTGGLLSIWISVYSSATSGRATKDATAENRRTALLALKDQLFDNLLTLAKTFKNQEDKADLYCPQHYLEDPVSAPAPAPAPTPAPPAPPA